MQVVIAGAGSVGRSIARELLARGHQVTLCDSNPEAMKVSSVAEANWILGDVASPDVMERAGTKEAEVIVAATGDDRANLVISLLAKTQFGVPRVIARVNNPKNEWMFDESWGVDVPVSTPRMMTSVVEEAVSVGVLVRIFHFNAARTSLYSVILPPDCPVLGLPLLGVSWPEGVLLVAVLRDGQSLPASLVANLEPGDQLLFLLPDNQQGVKQDLGNVLAGVAVAHNCGTGVGAGGESAISGTLPGDAGKEVTVGTPQEQPTQIGNQGK
ncbi:putative bacteriochlorophyll 4-vinyl reductase [Mobiluncus mulieris 28-1]|uniref:Trk system potassium uptake protein TrkA n=1 Tax=Mobiluncus mulieris TaxID=2052 RepID=A0A7Y0USY0_9ACTO|nr:TrkA family potassium uptake protein [Mobiluncus mulieris]EEZ91122.1 putative bacteriochlorophyll 4-vinyl reductase [Mobiluncus mulieris 28-1]MCU9995451.1 TrkA family potassium uptake protein [Mobiluncus mulieris]NMX03151.1 TrkA family potassium uptake protein [Mobiluncus mulieris]